MKTKERYAPKSTGGDKTEKKDAKPSETNSENLKE